VVTPSRNQGTFLERTIRSVLSQGYPDLEHVVVDGMSTDSTPEVLGRHPHLKVIREPDRSQADALNKGLRAATGSVLSVLNSDDTFAPGALARVAAEIDPAAGRHVVLGRCRFVDEADRFLGVEHPSGFESHRRVLEIWKGHMLPQPAVFWTRQAWERCGPFDEAAGPFLDYDFFCRLSREFPFHYVDQVLAHYRLHAASQTASMTDQERLARAVPVSRRHWGSPARALYWQVLGSWLRHRVDRRRRAVGWLRQGRESWRRGRWPAAAGRAMAGALMAPDVLADVVVLPAVRGWARKVVSRHLLPVPGGPQTLAWRDFDGVHDDGWVGPRLVRPIDVPTAPARLHLRGTLWSPRLQEELELAFFCDGTLVGRRKVGGEPSFSVRVPLPGAAPGRHEVRVEADPCFVPDRHLGNRDHRPLAFHLDALEVEEGDAPE
jgi:glycosyltransferase involved in cell wall biosynthesis